MTSVRFAPSPTGRIHIGNARTAILNWLFALKSGGQFVLRYDDTDTARSTEDFAKGIAADLDWLGIKPQRVEWQSKRFGHYDEVPIRCARRGGSMPATRRPTNSTAAASASSPGACRRSMTARR